MHHPPADAEMRQAVTLLADDPQPSDRRDYIRNADGIRADPAAVGWAPRGA